MKKRPPCRIEIISDGEHVRIIKQGHDRYISEAIETAAFTDSTVRASVILACAEMFRTKHPDLFVQILTKLEIEAPTAEGRRLQQEQAKKLLAA